jgi:Fe-S-cluster containining protein
MPSGSIHNGFQWKYKAIKDKPMHWMQNMRSRMPKKCNKSNHKINLHMGGLMVKCLKCGKCCIETQMPLTRRDIERIERLGYRRWEFSVENDGKLKLRNINGHCYFLNPKNMKCKIYRDRPEGCRIYPVVYIEGGYVGVDDECPASKTVTIREICKKKPKLIKLLIEVEGLRK